MKTLADAVCLRMPRLGLGMLSVIYAQIKLVIMSFQLAAVLCTPIRQHADMPISCEVKKGKTRSLSKSAPVIGVLVVYSLAAAHLEEVSTKVC